MFRKNKPKIIYEQVNPIFPPLTPIKDHVPKWYREAKRWTDDKPGYAANKINATFKICVPFRDSMLTGYAVPLVADVVVVPGPRIQWPTKEQLLNYRQNENASEAVPIPAGYHSTPFVWINQVSWTLPKGYSALITHPLNRFDLPFLTLSAVVDDGVVLGQGNVPFYLKEGFEGIIPIGTPIMQIIPFKRESWESEKIEGLVQKGRQDAEASLSRVEGWYKTFHWKKKAYN